MRDFEIAAGGGVDLHRAFGHFALGWPQERKVSALGDVEIIDDGAHCRDFGARESAVGVERGDIEKGEEPLFARGAVKAGSCEGRHGSASFGRDAFDPVIRGFGEYDFAGREAGKIGAKAQLSGLRHPELSGRDIGPCDGVAVADDRDRREEVVLAGIEQAVFGQCAGGNEAGDAALDYRFRTPLLGLGRAFKLLANRDAKALADQGQEISVGCVNRHAAHRDVVAQMLAALRQRDVQRGGSGDRIIKEHLVKIAHPIEEQSIGVVRLDL